MELVPDVNIRNGKMKLGEEFIKTNGIVIFLRGELGQRRGLFIISGFSIKCL